MSNGKWRESNTSSTSIKGLRFIDINIIPTIAIAERVVDLIKNNY